MRSEDRGRDKLRKVYVDEVVIPGRSRREVGETCRWPALSNVVMHAGIGRRLRYRRAAGHSRVEPIAVHRVVGIRSPARGVHTAGGVTRIAAHPPPRTVPAPGHV